MVDPRIVQALKEPGSRLPVVVRPKKKKIPDASKSTQLGRFSGLGYIDSPAIGNGGRAVFVKSAHWPYRIGVFWVDEEVFIPSGRIS